eukprot:scaffold12116_cov125-Cylindrotheca_fusiformis.AAC.4
MSRRSGSRLAGTISMNSEGGGKVTIKPPKSQESELMLLISAVDVGVVEFGFDHVCPCTAAYKMYREFFKSKIWDGAKST